MEEQKKVNIKKWLAYSNAFFFLLILTIGGILFIVLPKQEVSDLEKRKLTPMPALTGKSYFSGEYTAQLDLFFSDNFPFRETLVMAKDRIESILGFQSEIDVHKDVSITDQDMNDWVMEENDTTDTQIDSLKKSLEKKPEGSGIVVINGRAIQLFGGNDDLARFYANVLNEYSTRLKGVVNIFNVLAPSPSDLYLSGKYAYMLGREKRNIDLVSENSDRNIVDVDVYTKLMDHKDEYIYFNTDHHWTGLGAYYAYESLCEAIGFTPVNLNTCTKKTKHRFLGTLYSLTRNPVLARNPDSVVYYLFPVRTKTMTYLKGRTNPVPGNLFYEHASGGFSFGVYLGGDFPLMEVETNTGEGRRALVVKNSIGNPFATYLVNHYEKIYILDYRYYKGDIVKLLIDNNITDLIFVNSVILSNAPPHLRQLKNMITRSTTPVDIEEHILPDSIRIDSIQEDAIQIDSTARDSVPEEDSISIKIDESIIIEEKDSIKIKDTIDQKRRM
jgi:hypothetical protein